MKLFALSDKPSGTQITVEKQAWVLKKGLVESRVGGSEYRSGEEFLRGLED
jgi:hypothetical protein